MTASNVLSDEVIIGRIMNRFSAFSSYLERFLLETLFSETLSLNVKLAASVVFCLFIAESPSGLVPNIFLVLNKVIIVCLGSLLCDAL